MTPGSRVAAAIELLAEIAQSFEVTEGRGRPADATIAWYFKNHRYVGSKDRGSIAMLVYYVLRNKALLEWQAGQAGLESNARGWVIATLMHRSNQNIDETIELFEDRFHTGPINDAERHALGKMKKNATGGKVPPEWVTSNVPEALLPLVQESLGAEWSKELAALNLEAPVDLRANTLKTTRDKLLGTLRSEELEAEACHLSPHGIRLKKRAAIFAVPSFKEGRFEVQDEGSQLVALFAGAEPGMRVIDFCAGAGGKTLAMAAQMQNKGKILAFDVSEKRLEQIKPRLKRAGVDTVQIHVIENEKDKFLKRHAGSADLVLVDAPCSGTGTWRRNPDLKWRTSIKDVQELMVLQASILASAAKLVKVGGRLVYVTCSILNSENNQQVEKFLVDNSNFKVVAAEKLWDKLPSSVLRNPLALSPYKDGTDGFFAAALQRVA